MIIRLLGQVLFSVAIGFGGTVLGQGVSAEIENSLAESIQRGTISITGTASASGAFGYAVLEIGAAGQLGENLGLLTSPVEGTTLFQSLDTSTYDDGHYVLKLSVFDANGNPGFSEISFFIDNTPPELVQPIQVGHLLYGYEVVKFGESVTLTGQFGESVEVTGVHWVSDAGNVFGHVASGQVNVQGATINGFLELPAGRDQYVQLELRCQDRAGNRTEWLRSNEILLVENVPLPFTRPSHEAMVLPDRQQSIRFEGLLWDLADSLDRVEWRQVAEGEDWVEVASVVPTWHGARWEFDWKVQPVMATEFEVRAFDRFGNLHGPAQTKVQLASHPLLDLQFPVVDLQEPNGVLYRGDKSVAVSGNVMNRPGQENFRWHLALEAVGPWPQFLWQGTQTLTTGQTNEVIDDVLFEFPLPSYSGAYQLRLAAVNSYGEAQTVRTFYVSDKPSPDGDGDGLSDVVEFELFGGLGETLESDFDGDGMSNEDELKYGFDASDGDSRFKAVAMLGDGEMELSWVNEGALGYELYRREDLMRGEWEKVRDIESGGELIQRYRVALGAGFNSEFYQVTTQPGPLDSLTTIDLGQGVGMEFVKIEPGTYTMGSPNGEEGRGLDEGPLTEVTISEGFLLGKYEVTIGEFRRYLQSGGDQSGVGFGDSDYPIRDDGSFSLRGNPVGQDDRQPMVRVSWHNAVGYCEWLTELGRSEGWLPEGYEYRLPTEAEWEYACRAGSETRFSFGDSDSDLWDYAWYGEYTFHRTYPVGEKISNPWGLHDMHGNVWEWCQDWYSISYPGGEVIDPTGAASGTSRVLRGGGWIDDAWRCRSAFRVRVSPNFSVLHVGFRVALVAVP